MRYEDMCHEQETPTGFEVEDVTSGGEVTLSINRSDSAWWPDCLEIADQEGFLLTLSPSDALHLLRFLEFHQERLMRAALRDRAESFARNPSTEPGRDQRILEGTERSLRQPLEEAALPGKSCFICSRAATGRSATGHWCCAEHQEVAESDAERLRVERLRRELDIWADLDTTDPN